MPTKTKPKLISMLHQYFLFVLHKLASYFQLLQTETECYLQPIKFLLIMAILRLDKNTEKGPKTIIEFTSQLPTCAR